MATLFSGPSVQCFLLLSFVLLAFHSPCSTATDPIYQICQDPGNYTSNSTFQANLKVLLTSLISDAPPTGYSNDTVGRKPHQVHGLALCRGDLTEAQCRECLAGAVEGVPKVCPHKKSATVWYDTCHVRYSDTSFFGSWTGPELYMWNVNNVSDPAGFGQRLDGLLDDLTRRAAYGKPSRMFAEGDVNSTGGGAIYGLVQCTRDLSADVCNQCLREKIDKIPTCCQGKQGGRVISGSCYLRYEVAPFFNASAAVSGDLPQPPAWPPTPTPAASQASPRSTPAASQASPPSSAAMVKTKPSWALPIFFVSSFFLW